MRASLLLRNDVVRGCVANAADQSEQAIRSGGLARFQRLHQGRQGQSQAFYREELSNQRRRQGSRYTSDWALRVFRPGRIRQDEASGLGQGSAGNVRVGCIEIGIETAAGTTSMPFSLTATGTIGLNSVLPVWARIEPTVTDAIFIASESPERQRAAWMAAAQGGDKRAYERVLAGSVPLIRAAARRQGVALDHLDDVVQETLLTVHRVRHTYDPSRSYDAWLSAIASRRAIDAMRSHGRRGRHELHDEHAVDVHPDVDDATAATEREQEASRLREAIATLPPGQREAIEELGLKEHTLAEAAVTTGRQTGALKVNLHRAMKALRNRFHGDP